MIQQARLTVRSRDIERSIAFYRDKLGFTLKRRFGERFADLVGPGVSILIHEKLENQPERIPSGILSIGLQVSDIDAARRLLEERGVVFEGETVEIDALKIAFTSDPDGVPLYIVESDWFRNP